MLERFLAVVLTINVVVWAACSLKVDLQPGRPILNVIDVVCTLLVAGAVIVSVLRDRWA
jgi:hypothetical protein